MIVFFSFSKLHYVFRLFRICLLSDYGACVLWVRLGNYLLPAPSYHGPRNAIEMPSQGSLPSLRPHRQYFDGIMCQNTGRVTTLLSNGLPHSPQRVRMFCVSHRCRCMVYVFVTSIRSATTHPCPNISTLAGEFVVPSVRRFGCSASSTPNCVHENKALVYVTDNVMCWNGWEKDIPPMRRVQRIFLVGNLFECSPHCSLFFVLRIN